MARAQYRSERGQTQAEYTVVLAAIAVACILAALFVGGAVSGLFDSSPTPLVPGSSPFTPPHPPAALTQPSSAEECTNEGWRSFPQFDSEAACLDYVDGLAP